MRQREARRRMCDDGVYADGAGARPSRPHLTIRKRVRLKRNAGEDARAPAPLALLPVTKRTRCSAASPAHMEEVVDPLREGGAYASDGFQIGEAYAGDGARRDGERTGVETQPHPQTATVARPNSHIGSEVLD